MIDKIAIDETLLDAACELGQHRSRAAAIEAALREYVARHRRQQIVQLFGTIEYDPQFDYKATRNRSEQ